jgi:hypothetical protein
VTVTTDFLCLLAMGEMGKVRNGGDLRPRVVSARSFGVWVEELLEGSGGADAPRYDGHSGGLVFYGNGAQTQMAWWRA